MIGPGAVEPLRAELASLSRHEEPWPAGAAAAALREAARPFPAARDEIVGILVRQLGWWARQEDILNTTLIDALVDLRAVEAAPAIAVVFAAGAADVVLRPDWEDVQVDLGLASERTTPRVGLPPLALPSHPEIRIVPPQSPGRAAQHRRKAGKAARRRNRKRR